MKIQMAYVRLNRTRVLISFSSILLFFRSSSDPEGIVSAHYYHQGPILHTYVHTGSLNIPAADHEELSRYKGPPI